MDVPARCVAELIAAARTRKDALAFASSGNGSAQRFVRCQMALWAKVVKDRGIALE